VSVFRAWNVGGEGQHTNHRFLAVDRRGELLVGDAAARGDLVKELPLHKHVRGTDLAHLARVVREARLCGDGRGGLTVTAY